MPLSSESIVITGVGMVSSLGLDAVTACAAARAGVVRTTVLDDVQVKEGDTDELTPLQVHAAPLIADGFTGLGRLVQLGTAALQDLMRTTDLPPDGRTGLYVALPDGFFARHADRQVEAETGRDLRIEGKYDAEWQQEKAAREFLPRLKRYVDVQTMPKQEGLVFGGPAGFARVLQQAVQELQQGGLSRCLVGGVDSYLGRALLGALHRLAVLKTPDNADGFIPGEAAAFLLLERADTARRRQAPIGGVLQAPAWDTEPFHRLSDRPAQGEALARVVGQTLAAQPEPERAPGLLIGGLNGDAYRAVDWGYALVRLQHTHGLPATTPAWYPAVSFGEIGAAGGPAALCLGVRAFDRRYAGTNHILTWMASPDGARAAVSLHHVVS